MADYTCYTEVVRQRVYTLTLPTDRDEIYKALNGATNDWARLHPSQSIPANALLIQSDGETLTISFEVERTTE